MKLLINDKIINTLFVDLNINFTVVNSNYLCNYKFLALDDYRFYTEESQDKEKLMIAELDDDSIWKLDKYMNPMFFSKEKVFDKKGELICYRYTKNQDDLLFDVTPLSYYSMYEKKSLQMNKSDVYLFIPGKLKVDSSVWNSIENIDSLLFELYREKIEECMEEEYNTDFVKNVDRKCIGNIEIEIRDLIDGQIYRQNALAMIAKHETGICILEIMILNCCIGGNKLLNYYCGDAIGIVFNNIRFSIQEFCDYLKIRRYGKKRSMIFGYGNLSKEEMINALANEEFPMGKIRGEFEKIINNNIAMYDTAEVYVSYETLLEKCKYVENIIDNRISYHAIEIFFVELILFQDASIDKVYCDLRKESKINNTTREINQAIERYEQISFDMSQAIKFADYSQFKFPTVKYSAKNVAKSFGIDFMFEKYESNKQLLSQMINANKRKVHDKQENLENFFLLIISAVASIDALGEILYNIWTDFRPGLISYSTAVIAVIGGYCIYRLATKVIAHSENKKGELND